MPLSLLQFQTLMSQQPASIPAPSTDLFSATAAAMQESIIHRMMTRGVSREGAAAFTQQRHVTMQNDQTRIFQIMQDLQNMKAGLGGAQTRKSTLDNGFIRRLL